MAADYTEDDIKSLDWREHIRMRPGMYIGKLGDGSSPDDGLYILLKEAIDNSIDEHIMGYGKEVKVEIDEEGRVEVRDFGRGIPLGKLFDCAAQINTGAKYDSEAFKKSVGLNGVGIKAVNALSDFFEIQAWRDGETKALEFSKGQLTVDMKHPRRDDGPTARGSPSSSTARFSRQGEVQGALRREDVPVLFLPEPALTVNFNGKKFRSKDGLLDLLREEMENEALYPPIHLIGKDIEIAFTHTAESSEEYYTFVNGQNTSQGGTHLAAFREALVQVIRGFYKKQYEPADIRAGIEAAVCVRIVEPVFESQTKTKLGSTTIVPDGESLRTSSAISSRPTSTTTCTRTPQVAEAIQKAHPSRRARAQGPQRRAENRPRTRQTGEGPQQETPRLPRPLRQPNTSAARNPRSSSPRATPPPAPSPSPATWKPRPCSRCAANRSTPSPAAQDRL
jgi:topoisomerase IV subunit B